MAAKLVDQLPEGDQWLYEVKLDGYRALLIKNGDRIQIRSRNDNDLTRAYPGVATAGRRLAAESAVIDGEIVAVGPDGRPSFQALQNRATHADHSIVFYAFDVLHLDGRDIRDQPLDQRKAHLPRLVGNSGILISTPLAGTAAQVVAAVRQLGLEGVVAKRRTSRYDAGLRSEAWLKLKLEQQQEFVVGGYRPGNLGVDALLVGFYVGRELRFAGSVRAGFTPPTRRAVFELLRPLDASRCPFADLPSSSTSRWGGGITAEQMEEMQWVKPSLVAQIRFVEWTDDDHLRHAAYLGIRTDKEAKDVTREG